MDNLLTIAFEAHNVEKNHHRSYQVILDAIGLAQRNGAPLFHKSLLRHLFGPF